MDCAAAVPALGAGRDLRLPHPLPPAPALPLPFAAATGAGGPAPPVFTVRLVQQDEGTPIAWVVVPHALLVELGLAQSEFTARDLRDGDDCYLHLKIINERTAWHDDSFASWGLYFFWLYTRSQRELGLVARPRLVVELELGEPRGVPMRTEPDDDDDGDGGGAPELDDDSGSEGGGAWHGGDDGGHGHDAWPQDEAPSDVPHEADPAEGSFDCGHCDASVGYCARCGEPFCAVCSPLGCSA